jgi:DNA polymerase V
MGDIARCSVGDVNSYYNEDLLYRMFGVNAELLIDHAWGWEPCTIKDIKLYKPQNNSICSGQVLQYPYTYDKADIVIREMTDALVLDLVEKDLVTDQIVLTVGYDVDNLMDDSISGSYQGEITTDHYGRRIPKHAHGTANIGRYTSSTKLIIKAVSDLYERIINKKLLIRRINVTANHVIRAEDIKDESQNAEQMNIFVDYEQVDRQRKQERASLEREKRMQKAVIGIKKKYGKNAILKGMNLQEGATAKERNGQIGGHKA